MKKLLVITALLVVAAGGAFAQNYMIVNSETIFKSIDAYNNAVTEIDSLAKQYQKSIDDAYAELETQYNTYMQQKNSLTQNQQQQRENTIINNEKRIAEYQEAVFGESGSIAKLRAEKLEPIQKRVFDSITKYARDNNYGLALDVATNPLVIYYEPSLDKTQQIISILK